MKSDQTTDDFTPGDVVFAKMKGYPFWPARIAEGKAPKNKIPIFFYGTHSTTFLFPKDIVHYWPNKQKYAQANKRGGFEEGMWEIENDPGVGLRGQKKAALVKRLSESRLKWKNKKKKKAENQTEVKKPPKSAKDPVSNSDSKAATPHKRETKSESVTLKDDKNTETRPTRSRDSSAKTSTDKRRTDKVVPARKMTSVKTITTGWRRLPSSVILARRMDAAKTLSAHRKHVLNRKIISTAKKRIDAVNHRKPSRITRSTADPIEATDDVTVKPLALKRKRKQTNSEVKGDAPISIPATDISASSTPTGSKRRRLTEPEKKSKDDEKELKENEAQSKEKNEVEQKIEKQNEVEKSNADKNKMMEKKNQAEKIVAENETENKGDAEKEKSEKKETKKIETERKEARNSEAESKEPCKNDSEKKEAEMVETRKSESEVLVTKK